MWIIVGPSLGNAISFTMNCNGVVFHFSMRHTGFSDFDTPTLFKSGKLLLFHDSYFCMGVASDALLPNTSEFFDIPLWTSSQHKYFIWLASVQAPIFSNLSSVKMSHFCTFTSSSELAIQNFSIILYIVILHDARFAELLKMDTLFNRIHITLALITISLDS